MAFLSNVKKAFGFSSDDDIEDLNDDNYPVEQGATSQPSLPQHQPISSEEFKFSEEIQSSIFEHVVAVFNSSLPEFLKASVDAEAQKKYLFQTLDESIKNYLSNVQSQVKENVEATWSEEQNNLKNEMNALKEKAREIEEKRSEVKQQQLSAERQKRALSERVHDLESQVLKLEADAEQYDIENKSLINKLKIANLHEKDLEDLRAEVARLQKSLLEQRNNNAENESNTEQTVDSAELTELKAALEQANVQLEQAKAQLEDANTQLSEAKKQHAEENAKIANSNNDLQAQNDGLVDENSKLKSVINQLEVKSRMGDEMVNDLNKRASDAIHKLASKEKELADVKERLEFANNELKIAEEIQGEIEKFEAIKKKKDTKIANLKKQVAELQAQNDILKKENNKGIDRKEIPTVENDDFDSSLDDVDWFVAPEPEPQKPRQNDDFGYQEPPRKPQPPENDAQLLLW
jgi:myosin heavy subunit